MSLLEKLRDAACWESFRQYKLEHGQLSPREERQLDDFIAHQRYLPIAETLQFDYPEKKQITKSASGKKRTVYCFRREETWILKLLG